MKYSHYELCPKCQQGASNFDEPLCYVECRVEYKLDKTGKGSSGFMYYAICDDEKGCGFYNKFEDEHEIDW